MKNENPGSPENQDPLDALLGEGGHYVPDNGFTARVMKTLPARKRNSWRRWEIFAAALFLCTGLTAWQWPALMASMGTIASHLSLYNLNLGILLVLLPPAIGFGSLLWLIYAFTTEED